MFDQRMSKVDFQKKMFYGVVGIWLIFVLLATWKYIPTRFDDAYMFLRFGKNFLAGHGFSWNPEDGPIYGCTSVPFLFLVTLLKAILPLQDGVLLPLASSLWGVVYIVILMNTVFSHLKSNLLTTQYKYLVMTVLLVLVVGRGFLYHSFTGMDTTLSMLANVVLIHFTLKQRQQQSIKSVLHLALAAYFAVAVRPDNLLYAVLFPGLLLLENIIRNRKYTNALCFGLVFGGLLVVDLLLKKWYFGDWLPLSYFVKQNGFYEGYTDYHLWNALEYTLNILTVFSPFILIAVFATTRRTLFLALAFLVPVLSTFIWFFTSVQIMGMEARLYYPSTPFIVFGALYVLDNFITEYEAGAIKLALLSPVKVIIAFGLFLIISNGKVLASKYEQIFLQQHTTFKNPINHENSENSLIDKNQWFSDIEFTAKIAHAMPEGTSIAATEIGLLSALGSHIRILDMTGLQNPEIAHQGFSAQKVLSHNPDVIFLHKGYSKMNTDLFNSSQFVQDYEIYTNVFYGGMAIRKDGSFYDAISNIVESIWSEAYPNIEMNQWLWSPSH